LKKHRFFGSSPNNLKKKKKKTKKKNNTILVNKKKKKKKKKKKPELKNRPFLVLSKNQRTYGFRQRTGKKNPRLIFRVFNFLLKKLWLH
jgi:hypothetical protein